MTQRFDATITESFCADGGIIATGKGVRIEPKGSGYLLRTRGKSRHGTRYSQHPSYDVALAAAYRWQKRKAGEAVSR